MIIWQKLVSVQGFPFALPFHPLLTRLWCPAWCFNSPVIGKEGAGGKHNRNFLLVMLYVILSINTLVLALIAEGLGRREGSTREEPAKKP